MEFTAPILGKKLADNKEFLKEFKINYESVRDMHQRTQKLWFDPDRIKNDSAEENSSDKLNSETEIDDESTETEGGDDDVILKTGSEEEPINFETASEVDEKFIPFTMRLQM